MPSERYSKLVDEQVEKHGGDQGGLIDSIGKYWVLSNGLAQAGHAPEKLDITAKCTFSLDNGPKISTIDLNKDMLSRIRLITTDLLPMTVLGLGLAIWLTRRNK